MNTRVRENAGRLNGLQEVLDPSNHELEKALGFISNSISSHGFNDSILYKVLQILSHHLLPSVGFVLFLQHSDNIQQVLLDHGHSRYLSVVHIQKLSH